jgi:hypothetical protein
MEQLNLFLGKQLRDNGIYQSMENADSKGNKWTYYAYQFLLYYIKSNKEFMAEDVRIASNGIVDNPPSQRAWGGIFVRAVKAGLIKRKGFMNVKNAKAHCTPATLWEVC